MYGIAAAAGRRLLTKAFLLSICPHCTVWRMKKKERKSVSVQLFRFQLSVFTCSRLSIRVHGCVDVSLCGLLCFICIGDTRR